MQTNFAYHRREIKVLFMMSLVQGDRPCSTLHKGKLTSYEYAHELAVSVQAKQIRCNKRFIQTAATASSAARKSRHILLPLNNPSSDWEKAERLQNLLEQGWSIFMSDS